jgi:GT2 family glycosyltransferase
MLKSLHPDCGFSVIEQENRGLAGARNTGFRAAESDLVLFLDDDMRCHPGLLKAHLQAHKRLGPAVVFGALFLASDSIRNLASECFNKEIGAFHIRHKLNPKTQWQVTECVFSNSSISRTLLDKLGGFDQQFRMREDLELGIRLLEAGIPMEYVSDAIAYQYYDKTSSDLLADAERFAIADVLLARKHPAHTIEGHLKWMESEPQWKQEIRSLLAQSPALENIVLSPWCGLGELFFGFPPLRSAGVRALQIRRRIHWLRVVQKLTAP